MAYEYVVVPAPKKGLKAKGVKTVEDRFAHALQTVMNEKGAEGWEYVRTDILPAEERQGLTGSKTTYQTMMVFRRELAAGAMPLTTYAPEPAPVEPQFETRTVDDSGRVEPQLRAE